MEFLFLFFPIPIDNNIWYARIGIFNCLIRYVFTTVRPCCDINWLISFLNKTKSYLALFLPFLIFLLWCNSSFFIYLFFTYSFSLSKPILFSYTSNETSFLVSLHCLLGKSSLNYSVSCQFSLLTYSIPLICTSCIWNETLLIQSGDVELNPGPKK